MNTHVCRNCGSSFEGRKNKVYCCTQCKTIYNNTKSQERNSYYNATISEVKRNREIVGMIHKLFGSAMLPKSILNHTKLNYGCITGISRTGQTIFGDYEIQTFQDSSFRVLKLSRK